jgi:predicted TIM-barrel fold metal-dependent hydrolase
MARAPNVHLKISNPGAYVPGWSDADIVRIVRACINSMGHDRVMFGSDLPVSTLFCTTQDLFRLARASVASDSSSAQERFFYRNAKHLYGMD